MVAGSNPAGNATFYSAVITLNSKKYQSSREINLSSSSHKHLLAKKSFLKVNPSPQY
jgi:hypothetical protein